MTLDDEDISNMTTSIEFDQSESTQRTLYHSCIVFETIQEVLSSVSWCNNQIHTKNGINRTAISIIKLTFRKGGKLRRTLHNFHYECSGCYSRILEEFIKIIQFLLERTVGEHVLSNKL